jgi:hypothetical protein
MAKPVQQRYISSSVPPSIIVQAEMTLEPIRKIKKVSGIL